MMDIEFQRQDAATIRLKCERWLLEELAQKFEFFAPNYRFHPKFKAKVWNGKISVVDRRYGTIPSGLLREAVSYCKENGYTYSVDIQLIEERLVAVEDGDFHQWVETIPLDPSRPPRDFQLDMVIDCIRNRRRICLSATGSGKSLTIFLLVRWLLEIEQQKRIIIIVPTTNLVDQLVDDFVDYDSGWKEHKNITKIYAGSDINPKAKVFVSTWQSLVDIDQDWMDQFEAVIFDEVHLAAAKSTSTIMQCLRNASVRIGFTGTLSESKTHEMVLRGLFGAPRVFSTTSELIERGILADLEIQPIILRYPDNVRQEVAKKKEYQSEISVVVNSRERMEYICQLANRLTGNILFIFNRIDEHAEPFYEMLQTIAPPDVQVHYFTGSSSKEERRRIRRVIDANDGEIRHWTVGSSGVISTGTNIVQLDHAIFCHPQKAKIRNLQTIGRVLRRGNGKTRAKVWDIVDDLSWKSRQSYTMKHFDARLNTYLTEELVVLEPMVEDLNHG